MRPDRERGATSVEFALVVPLFLVLVSIAGYFGWQLYTESQLERAAQRAARFAAVPTSDGAYAYAHCDVVDAVNNQLSSLSVVATNVAVSDADAALPATACPTSDVAARPRGYVRVRVTYELDNPFSNLLAVLFDKPGPMTITGSGEARVEDTS